MSQQGEPIEIPLDDIFTASSSEDAIHEQLVDVARLLVDERAPVSAWLRLVHTSFSHGRTRQALYFADQALAAVHTSPLDHVPVLCLKANYHVALARKAPKQHLVNPSTGPIALPKDPHHPESLRPGAPVDPAASPKPLLKQDYLTRAGHDLANAEALDPNNKVVRDIKAAWLLASGQLDLASKTWEAILADEPNHLMALMGRVRPLLSLLCARARH